MQGWEDVLEDEVSGGTAAAWLGAMAGALAGIVAVVSPLAGYGGGSAFLLVVVSAADGQTVERMIPFVAAFIDQVDVPGGRITVDWQPDY